MAKETIHAIREAEAEAAKTEADAVKEAARIVEEAKQQAAHEKEQAVQEAQARADRTLDEARSRCRAIMEEAVLLEKEEAAKLEHSVSGKKAQAVQAVLEYLL